jgi:hypothetical protein
MMISFKIAKVWNCTIVQIIQFLRLSMVSLKSGNIVNGYKKSNNL